MVRGGRAVGTKTDMSTSGGRGFGHAGQRQSRQSITQMVAISAA